MYVYICKYKGLEGWGKKQNLPAILISVVPEQALTLITQQLFLAWHSLIRTITLPHKYYTIRPVTPSQKSENQLHWTPLELLNRQNSVFRKLNPKLHGLSSEFIASNNSNLFTLFPQL